MIPADRITIEGDRAWWVPKPIHRLGVTNTVGDDYDDPSWFMSLDRPCNHCEGTEWLDVEDINCDCIDGRHTFDVEVDDCCGLAEPFCHSTTYRACIVRVLPITDVWPTESPAIFHDPASHVSKWWYTYAVPDGWNMPISFPPAAAPGQYAVRLKLADKEET